MIQINQKAYHKKIIFDVLIFVIVPLGFLIKGYAYLLILTLFGIIKFWSEKKHFDYLKAAIHFPETEALVTAVIPSEVQNFYVCVLQVENRTFKIRAYKFEQPVKVGDTITILFDEEVPERSLIPEKEKYLKITRSTLKDH